MFWNVRCERLDERPEVVSAGGFVAYRHETPDGDYVDLHLECEDGLRGWRIEGDSLEGSRWATETGPLTTKWLEEDGGAFELDRGEYAWERQDSAGAELVLLGSKRATRVSVSRSAELPISAARAIVDALGQHGLRSFDAAGLISDGATARQRATERLCGLGKELDGDAFDDAVWRKTLSGLTLEEIHGQLRSFEVRFDVKYPPMPVSRPDVAQGASRSQDALAIVRG